MVDIGTGALALLAIMAAKAGAKKARLWLSPNASIRVRGTCDVRLAWLQGAVAASATAYRFHVFFSCQLSDSRNVLADSL